MKIFEEVKFDDKGLLVAITQDINTKEVLMQAFMNRKALEKTISTGYVHYYSRSRNKLWLKGEESGHHQIVKKLKLDCDGDSVVILVEQEKAACHTGNYSCFYREINEEGNLESYENKVFDKEIVYGNKSKILNKLYDTIVNRKENPKEGSYTNYLFDKGIDKILKKVGEESAEVIIASKNNSFEEVKYEVSDLMYHLLVLLVNQGVEIDNIYDELIKRSKG
ncbi:MAG: bifunctional phosphoribosyl-AMP cyclohydrolase/phosphoribosyl-ATP diphosphatase HisIE [Clostridiales bacterium]